MSTSMPGFRRKTTISLATRRQFHIAALRVMLTKAQQATKNDDTYFEPENFQKFTVHLYRLFSPNIEINDLTESFTEILDKLADYDDSKKFNLNTVQQILKFHLNLKLNTVHWNLIVLLIAMLIHYL